MKSFFPSLVRRRVCSHLSLVSSVVLLPLLALPCAAQEAVPQPAPLEKAAKPKANQRKKREESPITPAQQEDLMRAATNGEPAAQYELAVRNLFGDGVTRDTTKGIDWAQKAAEQGFLPGHHLLGVIFLDGNDTPKDEKKAVEHLSEAAEYGYAPSEYILGALYEEGRGVAQDDMLAYKWYRRAAWQGDAHAENATAFCLIKGKGVPQNKKEGMKWLDEALKKELPEAQVQMGNCFYEGDGVGRDFGKAEEFFRKAADQEHVSGLNSLAWMRATCPESKYQNGKEAIEKAEKSVELTEGKSYAITDTLAAAYARGGEFPRAVEAQKKALDLLKGDQKTKAEQKTPLVTEFEDRLKLYEQSKTYEEAPREPEKPKIPPKQNKPLKGRGNSIVA